jgi:hypothetical protein
MVRLHLPVISNVGAVLVVDDVEHRWQPGQLWYGDFSRQHLVRNTAPTARVHAVIDALLTRELASWFPPDWRTALSEGEVLFDRATPPPAPCPVTLPYATMLPHGFSDFGQTSLWTVPFNPRRSPRARQVSACSPPVPVSSRSHRPGTASTASLAGANSAPSSPPTGACCCERAVATLCANGTSATTNR